MKITDVKIDKFGVWQDLNLDVHGSGMTVIHGPNEAGKSTLMRFIRGVLYDFPHGQPNSRTAAERHRGWGGKLHVRDAGRAYELTRRINKDGQPFFRCQSGEQTLTESQFAAQLLPVDRDVFESVFTLGLKELRALSTLQTEQVSEYIYGSSLGMVGQRLLTAEQRTRKQASPFLGQAGDNEKTGRLFELSGQYDSVTAALSRSDEVMSRYQQSLLDCDRIEQQQRERKQRLAQMQQERTSLQYLQRVFNPWQRQQELKRELVRFEGLDHFPADGVRQLDELQRKQQTQERKLKLLRDQSRQVKQQLQQDRKHYRLRDHASGIRALIDLRSLVETAERHLAAVSADAAMLKAEVDEKMGLLGANWTIQKLDAVDTSPEAHMELVTAAKNYQNSLSRRARHRKKYQKVSDANHVRETKLNDQLKKLNINSLDLAIKQAQQRLRDLEQLGQLRIQESEFEQRIRSAQTLLEKYRQGSEFPWWASLMLTLFTLGGGGLFVAGLIQSVRTSWLIGAIFMFTGVMAGGLVAALRQHFETDDYHLHSNLEQEIHDCQQQLNKVRDQISRITGISYNLHAVYKNPASQRSKISETDLLRQANQKLHDLEELSRTQQRVLKTRKTLSVQRGKLPKFQSEVSRARQSWCELLKRLGLKETIRTNEAFQNWQLAVDAMQSVLKWKTAREDVQRQTELLAMFGEQMAVIAERMDMEGRANLSLTQILADWQQLLDQYDRASNNYSQNRERYRDLKRQTEIAETDLQSTDADIAQLLKLGRAKTAEEFRRNASHLQRSGEVRALLADISDQLDSLSREQPELAIVEEDLEAFNATQTQERMELIGMEIEDLQRDLANSHEELGRLRQTLTQLENDTTALDLQVQQQRIVEQTRGELADWLAADYAGETLAGMTKLFEQRFQPETLARASHYLNKLTCGRYEQVRTPFGARDLYVHQSNGKKHSASELSDGTREQLFLAIRLALVDILAEDNIELPMVLDDICVNFDQQRTEAAVETILEFAEQRQVLFFTCHLHLAELFRSHGIEPTWLPAQNEYEPHRLAG